MTLAFSSQAIGAAPGVQISKTKVTFDASYPTGGEAVLASDLGLPYVHFAICVPRGFGYLVQWDQANKKLMVFRTGTGADTVLNEVSAAASLATLVVDVLGFYFENGSAL